MKNDSTKKKVLLLITKSNWGGAQRYVYDLATHLDKELFSVTVVVGGNGQLTEMLAHQHIDWLSLPSLNNSLKPKSLWQTSYDLFTLLRQERPDILHVNSSVAGLIGTFVGRLARVPRIIFTAHGWAFNEERSYWQRIVFTFFHWLTVLLSHRTIAVSDAIIKQLSLPGTMKKMKVLHPGRTIGVMYDHEEARTTLSQEFPVLQEYMDDILIGSIAELHPIKLQSVLIKSLVPILKKFPQVRLIIIGEGTERKNLQQLIKELNLTKSVFLVGAINEAARLLKAFDIFVLSSRSEAYGYVLHEAGLAELPVIATNVGGIPEIIKNGVSGLLVEPNNPPALSQALATLLSDSTLRNKFSAALHVEMKNRTLEKMVRATEALYTL